VAFELTVETAPAWVTEHGLNPHETSLVATELSGGVSASVIAVTGPGVAVVVKQALPRLRVPDVWEASVDRTDSEVAALRLFAELTPGAVPRVLAHDTADHVLAIELLPPSAQNWQSEIAAQRVYPRLGTWAGATLGTWHAHTAQQPEVTNTFDSSDAFEQLRLMPFHETVMLRRPELAPAIRPYLAALRSSRRCLVDGDYAPKNILVQPGERAWVLDLEVAHAGNPIFDLGFFLSFVVLSAVRWPSLTAELRELADRFLAEYAAVAGADFAGDEAAVTGHTACLVLARTDGKSPAAFLDDRSRARARSVGTALLARPEGGIWSWL
jgi:5-methylthioribose kinase